jgi:hypothetical protein
LNVASWLFERSAEMCSVAAHIAEIEDASSSPRDDASPNRSPNATQLVRAKCEVGTKSSAMLAQAKAMRNVRVLFRAFDAYRKAVQKQVGT